MGPEPGGQTGTLHARPPPQALLAQTAPSFESRAKGQHVAGEGAQRRTLRGRPATAKEVASRLALLERRSPKAISAGPVAVVGCFGRGAAGKRRAPRRPLAGRAQPGCAGGAAAATQGICPTADGAARPCAQTTFGATRGDLAAARERKSRPRSSRTAPTCELRCYCCCHAPTPIRHGRRSLARRRMLARRRTLARRDRRTSRPCATRQRRTSASTAAMR